MDTVQAESRERDGASADAAVRLGSDDNVAVALRELPAAAPLPGGSVRTAGPIPAGHKVAVRDIAAGQPVVKYGQIIGFADRAITAGEHVHVHNVSMGDFDRDYAFGADARPSHLGHAAEPVTTPAVNGQGEVGNAVPANDSEIRWADEAERELGKVPFFVRGKVRRNTERFARDGGKALITLETLYDAKAHYGR